MTGDARDHPDRKLFVSEQERAFGKVQSGPARFLRAGAYEALAEAAGVRDRSTFAVSSEAQSTTAKSRLRNNRSSIRS